MRKTNILRLLLVASVLLSIFSSSVFADYIKKKSGKTIKGVIVENYNDRVIISTYKGEIVILKSEIAELSYDTPEQNLIALADMMFDKELFSSAYVYYQKALEINPNSAEANKKIIFLRQYLGNTETVKKISEVSKMQDIENQRYSIAPTNTKDISNDRNALKEKLGISIRVVPTGALVEFVDRQSIADKCGLSENDIIVAVWGKFIGYMDEAQILNLLLKKQIGEILITVEKNIFIESAILHDTNLKSLFTIKEEGLYAGKEMLTATGQIEKNDMIFSINGKSTRYMSEKDFFDEIKNATGNVSFLIRRDLSLFVT